MAVDHSSQANFPFVALGIGRPREVPQQARGAARDAGGGASFADALRTSAAEFRAQTVATLLAVGSPHDKLGGKAGRPGTDGVFSTLVSTAGIAGMGGVAGSTPAVSGLSPTGRNLALFDPESAYRMMTLINRKEVEYQAEFAEMRAMQSELAKLQQAGASLAAVDGSLDAAALRERLMAFVADFNAWDQRFDAAVEPGGLLAGTQAAQVARTSMRNSIDNPFFGAADGFRGMAGLGLTLDRATGQIELDVARLDAALAGRRDGAVGLMQEFGRSFARSAELLISEDNFVTRRLGRLDNVIDYIAAQRPALQAEFGLGDPAKPSGAVAAALAAYRAAEAGGG